VVVSRQMITAMETGDYAPSVYLAIKVARCPAINVARCPAIVARALGTSVELLRGDAPER
jgi:hypothetical protein